MHLQASHDSQTVEDLLRSSKKIVAVDSPSDVSLFVATGCAFLLFGSRRSLRRLLTRVGDNRSVNSVRSSRNDEETMLFETPSTESISYPTTGIELVSTSNLRRRHGHSAKVDYQDIWQAAQAGDEGEVQRHLDELHTESVEDSLSIPTPASQSNVLYLLLRRRSGITCIQGRYLKNALSSEVAGGHKTVPMIMHNVGNDPFARRKGYTEVSAATSTRHDNIIKVLVDRSLTTSKNLSWNPFVFLTPSFKVLRLMLNQGVQSVKLNLL